MASTVMFVYEGKDLVGTEPVDVSTDSSIRDACVTYFGDENFSVMYTGDEVRVTVGDASEAQFLINHRV